MALSSTSQQERLQQRGNKYNYSKRVEGEITNKFYELVKRVDKNCYKIEKSKDDYEVMDLTVVDSKGRYHLLEVKTRYGKYTRQFLYTNGLWVEKYKLNKVIKQYNQDKFTLIVVSQDDYVLKANINSSCETKKVLSNRTTVFDNKQKVEKEYLIAYNIEELGHIDTFLKK